MRPFHLASNLKLPSPNFAMGKARGSFICVEPNPRDFPEGFGIAPLSIGKELDKFTALCPIPGDLSPAFNNRAIALPNDGIEPIATIALDKSLDLPVRLSGGVRFSPTRV